MSEAPAAAGGRHYLGIFVLASATLAYQILITRFFSVMLYYHFAFAAISFAMLGLTQGAINVYRRPSKYAADRVDGEFARNAAWFALSGVAVTIAFLCAPLVVPEDIVSTVLLFGLLLFVVPFIYSGICIALLLTRLPYGNGRLYAADLSGAALGCVGIILLLFVIDPVSATLWIAGLAAAAGWNAGRAGGDRGAARISGAVAAFLLLGAIAHTGLYVSGEGHIGVFWAKGKDQKGTLFERWNTFSRIRVTAMGESKPFGWGFAEKPAGTIDQHYLDIDADAATVITRLEGDDFSQLGYLRDDVINAAYLVQPASDVAVVGVGGGRDILSALFFGAKRITGVEINPAIFEALTERFAAFSGHLDRRPGVNLVNAEARSYINQTSDRFDLVQISLIDTWAATAAGGLTLTENRLYTVEAFNDFYRALKPGGLLSVSRWYRPDDHRGEFYRLVAIAAEALQRDGVAADDLQRHVIALNVGNIVTVITRPDAFSDAEWGSARTALSRQGFTILLGPDIAFDDVTSTILAGKADAAYYAGLPENVAPTTDNTPFFFFTTHFGSLFSHPESVSFSNNAAVGMTIFLLIGTFIACLVYIGVPFARRMRITPASALAPPVIYFSAIGMGFMLVEISQMQRLMVFLGHPVYGLGVVLFTLLLFSGLGSFTVPGEPSRRIVIMRILGLVAALVLAGLLTPAVTVWAKTEGTGFRILVSVLLLAPPAFFMGMMFPIGLATWRRQKDLLPFFWSANGIASVFASILGMVLSMGLGITEAYAIGVCAYLLSVLVLAGARRTVRAADGMAAALRSRA